MNKFQVSGYRSSSGFRVETIYPNIVRAWPAEKLWLVYVHVSNNCNMIYSLTKGGTRPLYPSTTSTQSSHFNFITRNVSSIPETWWMHIFASSSVSNQFPKSPRYLPRRRQMYAGVTSAWIWALFDTPRFMNEHKLLHSSPGFHTYKTVFPVIWARTCKHWGYPLTFCDRVGFSSPTDTSMLYFFQSWFSK